MQKTLLLIVLLISNYSLAFDDFQWKLSDGSKAPETESQNSQLLLNSFFR